MNKEELVSYIHMLYRNWTSCDKTCQNLINHAKKLSDSNDELRKQLYFCEPYRFEDLYEGMWVWDDKKKAKLLIAYCYSKNDMAYYNFSNPEDYKYINLIFEENRFYPVTKAME